LPFRRYRGKEPLRFAHPAEKELAELLDDEGIPYRRARDTIS
jgi:hypothetical protein